jgi:drug/metabolite transporter (DMT)-like permease
MNNLALYLASVLIWGSTWLVITFQYGKVPPEVSVAYRFALAAILLSAWCLARGWRMRFTLREHGWLALQGSLMFGLNYTCVYVAEQHVPSGLMAVIFSLLAILNILGARAFFGTPLTPGVLAGSALGIGGVALVCLPGLRLASAGHGGLGAGLAFALLGTLAASASNLLAQRNHRAGLPVLQGTAWAMAYGAAFVGLYALAARRPFVLDLSARYLASLLYLSVFGSVLAFTAYLTLLGRIGAGRAGYTSVAIPVVALALSTAFEGLRWEWTLAAGAALCVLGNLLVLPRAPKVAEAAA